MSTTTSSHPIGPTADITTIKRHPIRGLLWGILMGVGLTLVLIITKVIALELSMMIIVTVAAILFGVVWGLAAPAKPVKGPLPAHLRRAPDPPPASRFDDFGERDGEASTDDGGMAGDESTAADDDATDDD